MHRGAFFEMKLLIYDDIYIKWYIIVMMIVLEVFFSREIYCEKCYQIFPFFFLYLFFPLDKTNEENGLWWI